MKIDKVKVMLGKIVYYDTGQIDIEGCSIKDFYLTACILRRDKKNQFFYQAELKELGKNSVIIVNLEKVKTRDEI